MSLTYGPLKGSVSGGNALKRILVRSMTGVGTMAAYLVGGPGGFGGVSGQLDNSILLRERIASNAGLAGEQEVKALLPPKTSSFQCPETPDSSSYCWRGAGRSRPPEQRRRAPAAPRRSQRMARHSYHPRRNCAN